MAAIVHSGIAQIREPKRDVKGDGFVIIFQGIQLVAKVRIIGELQEFSDQ